MYIKDKWLTEQFGYSVYNIKKLNKNILKKIDSKGKKNFSYIKSEKKIRVNYVKQFNFNFTEKNVIYRLKIYNSYVFNKNCRVANKKDKKSIVKLARNSFTNSRFFKDSQIKKKLAEKIKENWINNYFLGKRGNKIIVYESNNKILGFILLIRKKSDLIIDLIAVDKKNKGMGIGSYLIGSSIYFFKQCKYVFAGTQENNIGALKFYKKNKFVIFKKGYTFHRHYK